MQFAALAPRLPRTRYVSHAAKLATLLDSQFVIPGTKIRFGLDGLLGLVPGIGDTIALGLSLLIVVEAIRRGVRRRVIARMLFNVGIDWLIGLIPVLGDVFDVAFKANLLNLRLLEAELRNPVGVSGGSRGARI